MTAEEKAKDIIGAFKDNVQRFVVTGDDLDRLQERIVKAIDRFQGRVVPSVAELEKENRQLAEENALLEIENKILRSNIDSLTNELLVRRELSGFEH